jgi:MFS family permease
VFTAIGAGYLLTSMNAGRISARLGRQAVGLGAVVMVVGLVLLQIAVRSSGSVEWLTPGLFIDGLGMGMVLAPLASTVLSYVPPQQVGAGSGVNSTVMQVAGAVGVAVIGIIFYRALHGGYAHAFAAGLTFLTIMEVAVALLIQLLPKTAAEA